MGVGAGRDHDDRDVARAPERAAHLEAVDAREHDVDEHDVGRAAGERLERVLTGLGLLDDPALVLERQLHGGADALVVLDGQDAGSHDRQSCPGRASCAGVSSALRRTRSSRAAMPGPGRCGSAARRSRPAPRSRQAPSAARAVGRRTTRGRWRSMSIRRGAGGRSAASREQGVADAGVEVAESHRDGDGAVAVDSQRHRCSTRGRRARDPHGENGHRASLAPVVDDAADRRVAVRVTIAGGLGPFRRSPAPAASSRHESGSKSAGGGGQGELARRAAPPSRSPTVAPGLGGDRGAGGEVPRAEAPLVEGVDPPAGHRAQVDRRPRPCGGRRGPAAGPGAARRPGGAAGRGRRRSRWRRAPSRASALGRACDRRAVAAGAAAADGGEHVAVEGIVRRRRPTAAPSTSAAIDTAKPGWP